MDEREKAIKQRFELLVGELTERTRRLLAASEAMMIGWGGISAVSRATGLSRKAISQGIKQLQNGARVSEGRIRRTGGGRKKTVTKDPKLCEDLERLVEPVTRGDPQSPLRLPVQECALTGSGTEPARSPGLPSGGEPSCCMN
jgi:hypothetical protein